MPDADEHTLESLLSSLFEGDLSAEQQRSLEAFVKNDAKARALYFDYCEMHALLQWEHGVLGAEKSPVAMVAPRIARKSNVWRIWLPLATAALVAAALLLTFMKDGPLPEEAQTEIRAGEFVARVTGLKDSQFAGSPAAFQTGSALQHGQRVELASGFAEITFDSGAQVLLEGPAALDVNSAWDAVLVRGSLKASVPTEAIGFRVSSPSVDVVDLGTEFSMVAEEGGATEVFVLKGSVQAGPVGNKNAGGAKVLLKEKEARRFARSGVSDVADRERKAKRWAGSVKLERLSAPTELVHWSFDEVSGKVAKAEVGGKVGGGFDAHFKSPADAASLHGEGRWKQALKLDSDAFARVPFPGISNNSARSVAFWVKVPQDAPLNGGETVLAWGRKERKRAGMREVQIGWNSNAAHGSLGTLRTEIGRSFVTGSTSLRDGKWHHIAVTFMPGKLPGDPVHVSQYVDGRLDGITSARFKDRRGADVTEENDELPGEMLLVGCGAKPQQSKFRGGLDELYLVDRVLAPQEILQLMNENTLLSRTVAGE